ncbi:2-deoxyglucose-6-phosphate phosphatase [Tritrichomonas foetus]|uniref:2-deoxyglucose-6-phosphate phosphatase n=1 Tax=Tritrichomonas foetus TaxID=1144522 RepID=A0A1J4KJJ3_9EUKA|nr:2-deoxyglucose-6-phosphate phosphatase [Tritrichomonas foetus]|eukprot:OHT11379.1 2-deoxyglucose-6-phosphate phosphatase [Tritrichomonas foetus]
MCESLAALFDLDGVIFDTERHYKILFDEIGQKYCPEHPNFANETMGMSDEKVLQKYFAGREHLHQVILDLIADYDETLPLDYIDGFMEFVQDLKKHNVKIAIVTSSYMRKMKIVFSKHPELEQLIDTLVTPDKAPISKPDPLCYLTAAKELGVLPENCFVFEDSFNGISSGRSAKMNVIGLTTTNSADSIRSKCDIILDNFVGFTFDKMIELKNAK